ncbi:MAG TPA: enoyl-ACP reductase FabI [Paenalcaligenes sp.]|nr:enoyl-ACP reductase FabI [Paenalcaligenes sp.]
MAFLSGKRILITGVISNRSIAYGIAQACRQQGAEIALTYVGERFKSRIEKLAEELDAQFLLPLDVTDDSQVDELGDSIRAHWDGLDGLVHSIGFAPRESIAGDFLEGLSREAFTVAHEVSAYSFPALVKATLPLLEGRPSSVLTLTYLGAEKAVPHYNTMGLAKASLEASVRYLAASLGPRGIRANGLSAGPVRTLAASGIQDFNKILNFVAANSPLRRNVTIEDVGNTAAFLLSDLAAGITGEITHVDAGFFSVTPGMYPVEV